MQTHVDRRQNGLPLQYAMARTWKCGESRLGYELPIAVGGFSSVRHSVASDEKGFLGGRHISFQWAKCIMACPPPPRFGGQPPLKLRLSLKLQPTNPACQPEL
jgi:hypothetical protein